MRFILALSLILFGSLIGRAGDDSIQLTADIAYAKAKACIEVQRITGTRTPDCVSAECIAAKDRASTAITVALAEKKPAAPKPPAPQKRADFHVQQNGHTYKIDAEDRVWQWNTNGTYTATACRWVDGRIQCMRQMK
jgi:hypothetical protein